MIRPALLALAALVASGAAAQPTAPAYDAYALPGRAGPPAPSDTTTAAPPDAWLGPDKALHFGASFLLTLSGQYVLTDKAGLSNAEALPVAAGTALALGVFKEVSDSRRRRHPLFSWRDLAADAAGVALGAAIAAW